METEFQLLNARLSEKGDSLELAEEQIWKLWAEYMGYRWDGDIEYPDSFNLRDARNDLELYMKASEANVGSVTFKRELQRQIADAVIDDEMAMNTIYQEIYSEQFEIHVMTSPEGEQRIVQSQEEHMALMAQGWTHQDASA